MRGHTDAERIRQEVDQNSSESQVCHWPLSSSPTQLLENDVGVDDNHLQQPEKHLAPPLYGLVKKAVIGHQLVEFVHTQHELVVVSDHRRFLFVLTTPNKRRECTCKYCDKLFTLIQQTEIDTVRVKGRRRRGSAREGQRGRKR